MGVGEGIDHQYATDKKSREGGAKVRGGGGEKCKELRKASWEAIVLIKLLSESYRRDKRRGQVGVFFSLLTISYPSSFLDLT